MDAVIGSWKVKKGTQKNFDVLFKAMGIPDEAAEMYLKREYLLTFSKEGDKFTLSEVVTSDPNKASASYTYELDKEFETKDIDGYALKMRISWDGSQFHETYTYTDGSTIQTIRKVAGNEMDVKVTAKDVTATEIWEKC